MSCNIRVRSIGRTINKRHAVSLGGGVRMALKRNQGHASIEALKAHVDEIVFTRQIVAVWENLVATMLLLDSRAWYQAQYAYLKEFWSARARQLAAAPTPPKPALTWEVHTIRGDATNSSVVESSKAHVCEVMSLFGHQQIEAEAEADGGGDDRPLMPEKKLHHTYSDLQRAHSNNTGSDQLKIYEKQVQTVGSFVE